MLRWRSSLWVGSRQKDASGDGAGVGVGGIVVVVLLTGPQPVFFHTLFHQDIISACRAFASCQYGIPNAISKTAVLCSCCTGPVCHQGLVVEETDNSLPILSTETQSTTATSRPP